MAIFTLTVNRIGGVMVSVLASSVADRGFIDGVMVSVLASSVADRGFIGGVMVSVLASSVADRGFIGGVMVSVLASSVADRGFIGGVMVSILTSSVADRGFESRSGQTKDYKICICCFSAKHVALRVSGATCISLESGFSELALKNHN